MSVDWSVVVVTKYSFKGSDAIASAAKDIRDKDDAEYTAQFGVYCPSVPVEVELGIDVFALPLWMLDGYTTAKGTS